MGEAQFGELRIYLSTGLCILIEGKNGTTVKRITVEPNAIGFVELIVENICNETTEINMDYKEYYGLDITQISVVLVDENEQVLSLPHTVPAKTVENLKIKIDVGALVNRNQQFIIRTFFKSVV